MEQNLILNKILEIIPENYICNLDSEGYLDFYNEQDDKLLIIGLGSIVSGIFSGIRADIIFNDIEEIIHPKLKKETLYKIQVTLDTRQHGIIFNENIGEGIYENLPIKLDKEENVDNACSLIHEFIKQYAEPFFNYWQDIRDFLPFVETDDPSKINSYFSGYGMEKKIVIWYLCNHPRYKVFTTELIESYIDYLKQNPSDPWSKKDFKRLQSLLKRLEAVKPLYEWSDSYLIPKNYEK